jgi:hypothetical protein
MAIDTLRPQSTQASLVFAPLCGQRLDALIAQTTAVRRDIQQLHMRLQQAIEQDERLTALLMQEGVVL